MMDSLYSENIMRNDSVQPAPSGNAKSTTAGNANSILYGMDNYVNDVPQQTSPLDTIIQYWKQHQKKDINRQQNTSWNFSGTRATWTYAIKQFL